jgi:hypothetical protein
MNKKKILVTQTDAETQTHILPPSPPHARAHTHTYTHTHTHTHNYKSNLILILGGLKLDSCLEICWVTVSFFSNFFFQLFFPSKIGCTLGALGAFNSICCF